MSTSVFQPGEQCGGNAVVRLLGAGGFAQVYEVIDSTGARRALKVLDADAEARPKLKARLLQEGAALGMIEHVNVVRLFDVGLHEDRVYLLLELVEGVSLREALAGGGVSTETMVRWIRQACEGVAEAHRVGVVHRDLKPENILVGPQDLVKVIDFGVAKLSSMGVKTTHKQRLGTALYMAPEQIQGQPPDPRMDVYALGLVLYEALAGAHPIVPGPATVFEICARQLSVQPAPMLSAAPSVPPDIAAAIDRAIEKDPAKRLPSVRALADALHQALVRKSLERTAVLRDILGGATPVLPTPDGGVCPTSERSDVAASQVPTCPVSTPSRADTMDAPTLPVPTRAPAWRAASSAPALDHTRWKKAVALAIAVVLGVGGGVWFMTRVLAALDGAPARPG